MGFDGGAMAKDTADNTPEEDANTNKSMQYS
jgi:hypothetical protein